MIGLEFGLVLVSESVNAFLAGIFVAWTLPFLLFWGIYFVLGLIFISGDRYWPIGVYSLVILVVLTFMGHLHPIDFVLNYPFNFFLRVLAYFSIGLAWMSFRYVRFLHRMGTKRQEALKKYLESYLPQQEFKKTERPRNERQEDDILLPQDIARWSNELRSTGIAPKTPERLYRNLGEFIVQQNRYGSRPVYDIGTPDEPPLWKNHKSDFAAIWCYWPLDTIYYVIGDLLRDIFRWVSSYLQGVFDKIARKTVIKPLN